ncbi:MAG: DUF6092 family protein [Aigarchaeota archaeon]|nr:DUF6092 family protein [Candidatus Geocrenenecus dongiae]
MVMENLLNDEHFQLLAFLITSARGCIDEPSIYGPLRLIDAAEKIIDIIEKKQKEKITELEEIRQLIHEARLLVMVDEEEFTKILDKLTLKISEIIKKT